MANTKISALPTATTVGAADLIPIVQGGVTKQATHDLLPLSAAQTAALSATYAARAPELSGDFRSLADGALPATFASGQTLHSAGAATGAIASGEMTNTPTGTGQQATYFEGILTGNVRRMGAEFTLHGSGTGGTATMAVWQTSITAGYPTIPKAAAHFSIQPASWSYGIYDGGDQVIAKGVFATPLDTTGATKYIAEIAIDGSTAVISLPDGTTHAVTDARIASDIGPNAAWETFEGSGTSSMRAGFTRVWADSTPRDPKSAVVTPAELHRALTRVPLPTAQSWEPVTEQDVLIPTNTFTKVTGAPSFTFNIPDSVAYLLEVTAWVEVYQVGTIYWSFTYGDGGPTVISQAVGGGTVQNSNVTLKALVRPGAGGYPAVPGEQITLFWNHFQNGGQAVVKATGPQGHAVQWSVTPVTGSAILTP